MIKENLILASASPRRRDLLQSLGLNFTVEPSNLDESKISASDPVKLTVKLAREKARKVAEQKEGGIVLGADTVVKYEDEILEKPSSLQEAEEMLKFLRDSSHKVITGVCCIDKRGVRTKELNRFDVTHVKMRNYSRDEIKGYINSEEPLGKAGGYAIQGLGSLLVKKIEGSYFTVVGLPLHTVGEMLNEIGSGILSC